MLFHTIWKVTDERKQQIETFPLICFRSGVCASIRSVQRVYLIHHFIDSRKLGLYYYYYDDDVESSLIKSSVLKIARSTDGYLEEWRPRRAVGLFEAFSPADS